jgi:hypothetical protein
MTDDYANWYYNGILNMHNGNAKWVADDIFMALFTTFTPTQATDAILGTYGSTCTELAGNGYVRTALPSVAAPSMSGNYEVLASGNVVFPITAMSGVMGAAIYYDAGGTKYLLGYIDWALTGPKSVSGVTSVTITCPANGWFYNPITVST